MGTFWFIDINQESIKIQDVDRAKSYACRTTETPPLIELKSLVGSASHDDSDGVAVLKLMPHPLVFHWITDEGQRYR